MGCDCDVVFNGRHCAITGDDDRRTAGSHGRSERGYRQQHSPPL